MTTNDKPVIEVYFFDAGGGHRSAMTALTEVIAQQYPNWIIKPVNVQKVCEKVDPVYLLTRTSSEDFYNNALKKGWTYASRASLRTLQQGIKYNGLPIESALMERWAKEGTPDLAVSLIPNFNFVLYNGLQRMKCDAPYVTIMTDFADSPPNFWQFDQDQYMICGTEKVFRQAHLSGFYRPERIFLTSGMILKPSFYKAASNEVVPITLESLGLSPDKKTAIIMFGGNGSTASIDIMDCLDKDGLDMQYIVLCGKNEALKEQLKDRPNCHAVGFTNRVADYMAVADFFMGKPGPGSLAEAFEKGLPAIVENNAATMIQERYNITFLEEQGLGLAVKDFADCANAVRYLTRPEVLAKYKENTKKIKNRAVFEIPAMLDHIMQQPRDTVPNLSTNAARRWVQQYRLRKSKTKINRKPSVGA